MIDTQQLLLDLQSVLKLLEVDLLERSETTEVPDMGIALRAEYDRARVAGRTALNYEDWRSGAITQTAAAWTLSCVFVRFLEDNLLIDPPKISGPTKSSADGTADVNGLGRLGRARDEHELYFRSHPRLTDREYLLAVFDDLARLPGAADVFGPHNPVRQLPNWLSGDAAGELLRFFQKQDANTGRLIHDFTDVQWDTRFLGDLYQDLSEAARKKYALLQTPEFVESFILDRTLEPALDEFGLAPESSPGSRLQSPASFRMIDPACGSGHFLLGAFGRLLDRWQRQEPATGVRELAQRALSSVHGVDVNPFAIAIARFRLLLAAMQACRITRLAAAPGFKFNLACGDSLYHGRQRQQMLSDDWTDESHYFASEDDAELRRILREGTYHCVVANPPYITPKDAAANKAYRDLYPASCHMKYSLAVPFMERIFRLAVRGDLSRNGAGAENTVAGYTGQITANSFMKREFGKKLIESFFKTVDLTHVIDTSGAYIPGHGTPTVILLGRNQAPVAPTIRTVMGIRGEPSTPEDPAQGLVWRAILDQVDHPGSQSDYVSAGDSGREAFEKHPWSIGGGGAAELKEALHEGTLPLKELTECIGFGAILGEDDAFSDRLNGARIRILPFQYRRQVVEGDQVRDWSVTPETEVLFPYTNDIQRCSEAIVSQWLWPIRTVMCERRDFSKQTYRECGRPYWEYHQIPVDRNRTPLTIVFGEVTTHNHFVLDRGGKVFKQTAPVIKLPADANEDDHLALLGLLNSSTACFWMKQVCFPKGGDHVGQEGARVRRSLWDERYAFNATNLQQCPLPRSRPLELSRQLDRLAAELQEVSPAGVLSQRRQGARNDTAGPDLGTLASLRETQSAQPPAPPSASAASLREILTEARCRYDSLRGEMIRLQEDLDWQCYQLYGLIDDGLFNPPDATASEAESLPIQLGQRAFEIVLARKIAAGETQTTWFERHGSTPITELPADWPATYRSLVQRRIDAIAAHPEIALIEQPEYKRRWSTESWESQLERSLRGWMLDRLESYFDFDGRMAGETGVQQDAPDDLKHSFSLVSIARLADIAGRDAGFLEVGELYRSDRAFDVQKLVAELVAAESVPLLPVLRYKPSGLRKRVQWERTWELQRREDAGEAVGKIPVPPKYTSADFLSTGGARYWSLRGKLDVPKERWLSFPHCDGPDGTLMICWAGYNHLQQARAISEYYVDVQERLGGREDPRLVPLLVCLVELLPWLKQWHNAIDPEFGLAMGDYFEGYVQEEARGHGMTVDGIRNWQPPKKAGKARAARTKKTKNS